MTYEEFQLLCQKKYYLSFQAYQNCTPDFILSKIPEGRFAVLTWESYANKIDYFLGHYRCNRGMVEEILDAEDLILGNEALPLLYRIMNRIYVTPYNVDTFAILIGKLREKMPTRDIDAESVVIVAKDSVIEKTDEILRQGSYEMRREREQLTAQLFKIEQSLMYSELRKLEINNINDVTLHGDTITYTFTDVHVGNIHGYLVFDSLYVTVNLSTSIVTVESQPVQHPHVFSSGEMCVGTYRNELGRAVAKGNLDDLRHLLKAIITCLNVDSLASSTIEEDVDNGNVVWVPYDNKNPKNMKGNYVNDPVAEQDEEEEEFEEGEYDNE